MANEDEWRSKLSPEEYRVCREKGTEAPFSGEYYQHDREGVYLCKCCGEKLFTSKSKFDSGCGWPSFDRPESEAAVHFEEDTSHGMRRVEVTCDNCGSHLGHVFEDGPRETTGQRFCINSVSLDFKEGDQ